MKSFCGIRGYVLLLSWLFIVLRVDLLAQAPTGNVVINGAGASTSWPTGTYQITSLLVENGATLTIGGGSTLTVTAGVTVTGASSIVLQGNNTSAEVSGAWQGTGVTINAASVEVDAGSSINADGQGYVGSACLGPGAGPGGGPLNCDNLGNGGSYGGLGGGQNQSAMVLYGSASAPVDLGSGGSGGYSAPAGGAGGGAVRLVVSGSLTLNGTISANGATGLSGIYSTSGAGSGGSVYVTAGTLTGSGIFQANGGASPGANIGGGGGRIAVYYSSAANYTGFASTVAAGNGAGTTNGTVVFVDTSQTNQQLFVYQQYTIPPNSVSTFSSITVANGGLLTIGGGSAITVTGGITVTGSSSILLQSLNTSALVNGAWQGKGVTINAANVQVDAGSFIDADGQGYVGSNCLVPGAGPGGGPLNCNNNGNGGSYGGLGGGQNQSSMVLYGSASEPVDLGSGGSGGWTGPMGGAGGGAINMVVSGTLTNNGIISANGIAGAISVNDVCAGSGSGGSIYVTTPILAGSGAFLANGGGGSNDCSVGGGGGRIAIYYNSAGSYSGFTNSTAAGGYGGNNGTVVFVDTSQSEQQLNIYQQYTIPPNSTSTFGNITVNNGGTLTVGGGSALAITGAITVTGNSSLVLQSLNTGAQVSGSWQGTGATISATTVQVDAGSSMSADGQGYVGGNCINPGAGPGGGPLNCDNDGNGGSYGGFGGGQNQSAMSTYGSGLAPVDLGSGGSGGYTGPVGGAGGGAINLVVSGTLTNNGTISANGVAGAISVNDICAGGGSGGSIYVTTSTLAGSGVFLANGGGGSNDCSVGGGGGRVAIYYKSATHFTGFIGTTAAGGFGANNGTAIFVDTSQADEQLYVYQQYVFPPNSASSFGSINVSNAGTLTVGGGSTLTFTGGVTVTGNSSIVFPGLNTSAEIGGVWKGKGATINAATIEVDAGSSITADSQGYLGTGCSTPGLGPGGGPTNCNNYGNGGSYGGLGGGPNQSAMATYGSAAAPLDLGSGGSGGFGYGFPNGGAGGGAIALAATGTLTNNGVITANGGYGSANSGAGSGGSIYVIAGSLTGSGVFQANGGSSDSGALGGGGGRIAIYPNCTGFANITVTGGAGANNGTLVYICTPPVTVSPAQSSITTTQPLTVTITVGSGNSGDAHTGSAINPAPAGSGTVNFTPTGSVVLTSGTYTSASTQLFSGSAQIVVPPGALATGNDTLTATYTPDSNSASIYNTATGTSAVVTVTAPSIAISPSALSNGTVGVAYSQQITSSGGTGTVTYAVIAGLLPAGITLSSTGVLSGTPTAGGTFVFTIQATDSNSANGSRQYTFIVAPPTITVSPAALTTGSYGAAYSQSVAASGGTSSYTYALASGSSLPAGLNLNSSAGAITGTPTAAGAYTFTIIATDSSTGTGPYSGSQSVSLTINKAMLTVTAPSLAITYGQTLPACTATYDGFQNGDTSAVLSGSPSLTMSPETPSAAGQYTITAAAGTLSAANYTFSFVNGTLTINKAQSAASVTTSANTVFLQNSVSLTATVGFASAPSTSVPGPSGTVTFEDSGTPLSQCTSLALNSGAATCAISTLTAAAHSITAVYGGDTNFSGTTSGVMTETVVDFSIAVSNNSVTASAGSTATFSIPVSLTSGSTFPAAITLSVNGLPSGATPTFTPASLSAGAAPATVSLSIQLPKTLADVYPVGGAGNHLASRLAFCTLALLLLPFAGKLRRAGRRLSRGLSILLVLLAAMAAMTGLSGCGSDTGFYSWSSQTYTLTVTGTSGALSHSASASLTVE